MSQVRGKRVGKAYWRSLEELEGTAELAALLDRGHSIEPGELATPASRRAFLKLMGASLGLAGMTSCRWPKQAIVPFADRPEGRVPGVPRQFATAMELGGAAIGLLVTSYDGRPVKVEGNPLHPTSRGAADVFAQASVLELYDPDRSKQVVRRHGGQRTTSSWAEFEAFAKPHFEELRARQGAGLAVLSEESSSPSLARLRQAFGAAFPRATWTVHEPVSRDNEKQGVARAYGAMLRPVYHFDRADVIVCLDADPLGAHPAALRHARDFASRRRADDGKMNRLHVAEPTMSITGAMADSRVPAAEVEATAFALVAALAGDGAGIERLRGLPANPLGGLERGLAAFVAVAARDLLASQGRSLLVVGPRQDARLHTLACIVNDLLGNVGKTVEMVAEPCGDRGEGIAELAEKARSGAVETLLVLGGNPVYHGAGEWLQRIRTTIHLSGWEDETSLVAAWHLPRAHYLETWGDVRAWDGTVSVQQPLIEPLYGGRSVIEVVGMLVGEPGTGHEIVRSTFGALTGKPADETAWRQALHDGVVAGSGLKAEPAALAASPGVGTAPAVAATGELRLVLEPDRKLYDGRFANNPWLQELPDPLTRLTWDNAACVGPATARKLGVRRGDVVKLSSQGATVEAPVFVMPGQAEGVVSLALGYGRTAAGGVGNGVGVNAGLLRGARPGAGRLTVAVAPTGKRYDLVTTQDRHIADELGENERERRVDELVREGTLEQYRSTPHFAHEGGSAVPSLFTELEYAGEHQWGMAVDLSACTGCGACVLACQAENNVPVVGKEQMGHYREMHWLRVDRYFAGPPDQPRVVFQTLPCQHCEMAPCEQVCPVGATVHSEEGINQMAYNRCVGTRYCSNNCPFKVRHFNYFNYYKSLPELKRMVMNPEVTTRSRGVMEKCSFCIQRIERVKIGAKNDRRPIRDGEILPACAQTCPTRAIVFGDLKDPDSEVSRLHRHNRAYSLLAELKIRPRVAYLAKLRNPGPGEVSG